MHLEVYAGTNIKTKLGKNLYGHFQVNLGHPRVDWSRFQQYPGNGEDASNILGMEYFPTMSREEKKNAIRPSPSAVLQKLPFHTLGG